MSTTRRATVGMAGAAITLVFLAVPARAGDPTAPPEPTQPLSPTTQLEGGLPTTDDGPVVADDAVALDAVVGIDGSYKPGTPVPVVVTVRAERLIDADVRVTASLFGDETSHSVAAEIPGGSTKTFTVLVPIEQDRDPIRVDLIEDGTVIATIEPAVRTNYNEELVGVLPLVAAAETIPQSANLAIDAGTARFTTVTPELLTFGPDGLAFLDSVVATAGDLEAIDPTTLLAWVQAGGHLVIDEVSGPIPDLPDDWQPEPGLPARAGMGLVRLSEGRAKAGDWDTVILPTAVDSEEPAGDLNNANFGFGFNPVESDLTADAGFSLPPLGTLLGLLALYVLAVGPLTFVILRIVGKPTWLWIAVPVMAVLATAGVYLMGADLRSDSNAAHATIIQSGPAPGKVLTTNLVSSGHPGLELGPGWSPSNRPSGFGGNMEDLTTRSDGAGSTVTADVPAGGFAVMGATGTDGDGGLEVVATASDADLITGTVTNTSDTTLRDVGVLGTSASDLLGSLSPGESQDFALRHDNTLVASSELASRLWGAGFDFDIDQSVEEDDPVSLHALEMFQRGLGPLASPIGQVWVVGWTRDRDGPVDLVGAGPATEGRTGLFATQPVTPDEGPARAASFTSAAVRGPTETELDAGPDQGALEGFGGQNWYPVTSQTVLPRVPESGQVRVELWPEAAAEVFRDGTWQSVELDDQFGATFAVDAVAPEGLVHLRYRLDLSGAFAGGTLEVPRWFDPASLDNG